MTHKAAVARALHRAGLHDLAEDVEEGEVTPAAAIRAVKRLPDTPPELVAQLDAIAPDPAPEPDPEPDPEPEPEGDPEPDPEPEPEPNPPKPKGPTPSETHWYTRQRGRKAVAS